MSHTHHNIDPRLPPDDRKAFIARRNASIRLTYAHRRALQALDEAEKAVRAYVEAAESSLKLESL